MAASCTDGVASYRYERKFVIPLILVGGMPTLLRASSFGFREIFAERFVNNLYFDTPFFKFFNENVQGLSERKKIRIRWYGSVDHQGERRLEIKCKSGLVGRKQVAVLPSATGAPFRQSRPERLPLPPEIQLQLIGTAPALFNRYRRRYFLSADERFRATLDYDIAYSSPGPDASFLRNGSRDSNAVLELKYDCELDGEAAGIASELHFDIAKKSKYVTGVYQVYHS